MKKVLFTESQLKAILGEDVGGYLRTSDVAEKPDNAHLQQVFVNNADVDTEDEFDNNVTVSDKIARRMSNRNRLFPKRTRCFEEKSHTLDNMRNTGYGQKYNERISNTASNGGGKMINNLNDEVQSKTGSRNNTNQVRLSRLKDQKKSDPLNYLRNGGKETENILRDQITKQSHKNELVNRVNASMGLENTENEWKNSKKNSTDNGSNVYYY